MVKTKKNFKVSRKEFTSPFRDYWENNNYFFIALSLVVLIIGYILMAQGEWDSYISLSVSPLVLLLGYIILIPVSIFIKQKKSSKKETDVPSQS